MLKTVTSGERSATVTLDGTECEVRFSSGYNVVSVRAEGDTLIALDSGKSAGDDGTVMCKGGGTVMYPHMRNASSVFLTGTGKAEIIVSNEAVNPFKSAPVSGGGGGATIMTAEEWEASSKKDMGYVGVIESSGRIAGKLYNTDIDYAAWFENGVFENSAIDIADSSNYAFVSNTNQSKSISVNEDKQLNIILTQSVAAKCSIRMNANPIDVTSISSIIFDVDYSLSPNPTDSGSRGTTFAFCVSESNNIGATGGNLTTDEYNNFDAVTFIKSPYNTMTYEGHAEMTLDVSGMTGNIYLYIGHTKPQASVSANSDIISINSIIAM